MERLWRTEEMGNFLSNDPDEINYAKRKKSSSHNASQVGNYKYCTHLSWGSETASVPFITGILYNSSCKQQTN
jgi:hypothetical protein